MIIIDTYDCGGAHGDETFSGKNHTGVADGQVCSDELEEQTLSGEKCAQCMLL